MDFYIFESKYRDSVLLADVVMCTYGDDEGPRGLLVVKGDERLVASTGCVTNMSVLVIPGDSFEEATTVGMYVANALGASIAEDTFAEDDGPTDGEVFRRAERLER